jgi:hypothetical protein
MHSIQPSRPDLGNTSVGRVAFSISFSGEPIKPGGAMSVKLDIHQPTQTQQKPKTITYNPSKLKVVMDGIWNDLFLKCYKHRDNSKKFCEKQWSLIKDNDDIPIEKFMKECMTDCSQYHRLFEWSNRFDV